VRTALRLRATSERGAAARAPGAWPSDGAWEPIRAVLFDVDGTLYHQGPLRLLMAAELAALPLSRVSLAEPPRVWRALRVFRRVREELRAAPRGGESLADLQFRVAAERAGVAAGELKLLVQEWMFGRPLRYLRRCRRAGTEEFLGFLAERGIPAGAFSDYAATEKLAALGLAGRFEPVLGATDPEVNAFKPHPRGFLRACELWGVRPAEVLYVGDRPEVDAVGARAAGMACVIVSSRRHRAVNRFPHDYLTVPTLARLRHVLDR
jgi:putative hydrolase of the HAD superfamily